MKFGSICPCPTCSVASTGNMQMDIAFSDHRLPLSKLEELGGVLKRTGRVCGDDAKLRGLSFVGYVTAREPGIPRVELKPDDAARMTRVLDQLDQVGPVADHPLPGVPHRPGRRRWQFRRS